MQYRDMVWIESLQCFHIDDRYNALDVFSLQASMETSNSESPKLPSLRANKFEQNTTK